MQHLRGDPPGRPCYLIVPSPNPPTGRARDRALRDFLSKSDRLPGSTNLGQTVERGIDLLSRIVVVLQLTSIETVIRAHIEVAMA